MLDKKGLNIEICKKTEYNTNLFYGSFLDKNINKIFNLLNYIRNNRVHYLYEAMIIGYHGWIIYECLNLPFDVPKSIIFFQGLLSVLTLMCIILTKAIDKDSYLFDIISIIKYFVLLFTTTLQLFTVHSFEEDRLKYTFIRDFLMGNFLLILQNFMFRFYRLIIMRLS